MLYIKFGGANIPHFCLFEQFSGFKCSFCGATKSLELLFKQQILASIKINFLPILFIAYLCAYYFLRMRQQLRVILYLDKVFICFCILQFIYNNLHIRNIIF